MNENCSVVQSLAYRPDGSQIAAGFHNAAIVMYDAGCSKLCSRLKGHLAAVDCLEWSTDQLLLSGSSDHTGILWEVVDGSWESRLLLQGHTEGVRACAFGSEVIATASVDCTARIWSTDTGAV